MSNDYGYPSYELISKASNGDELAIKKILEFYEPYISKLCLRPIYQKNGSVNMGVDEEWKGEVYTAMMKAILKFDYTKIK